MQLVPAPAVRFMKRRVLSRPGVNCFMIFLCWSLQLFSFIILSFLGFFFVKVSFSVVLFLEIQCFAKVAVDWSIPFLALERSCISTKRRDWKVITVPSWVFLRYRNSSPLCSLFLLLFFHLLFGLLLCSLLFWSCSFRITQLYYFLIFLSTFYQQV